MSKMSFGYKMFFSAAAFSIPIMIFAFLTYRAQSGNIDFAIQERRGDDHQQPLMALLVHVGRHRLASLRAASSDPSASELLASLENKIDDALDRLAESEAQLGEALQFTEDGLAKRKRDGATATTARKLWQERKHAELIAIARTMIAHMGDTSNLILDPDLDSYYLMDVTLLALPQTIDRLQDILTRIEPLLARGSLSPAERISAAVFAAMLKEADIGRVTASTDTSLNEDANFYAVSESLQTKIPPALTIYKEASERFAELLSVAADPEKPLPIPEEFRKAGDAAIAASYDYWEIAINELSNLLDTRIASLSADRASQLLFALIALLVAGTFSFIVSRGLIMTFNAIVDRLSRVAVNVKASADQVSTASSKLSSSSAAGAASLEETVASLEQLSSLVSHNHERVSAASDYSRQAKSLAESGAEEMNHLIASMDDIRESSQKIEQIISVIDDIAFQTNLLALNAAVEAARAGDQGRGFAVVAEAVRTLAQRSGTAAKEISDLIRESTGRVDRGSKVALKSNQALDSIMKSIASIATISGEIAGASGEQTEGLTQISRAMGQLDVATQSNAAMAEETAATAEELTKESLLMENQVNALLVAVKGAGTEQNRNLASADIPHISESGSKSMAMIAP